MNIKLKHKFLKTLMISMFALCFVSLASANDFRNLGCPKTSSNWGTEKVTPRWKRGAPCWESACGCKFNQVFHGCSYFNNGHKPCINWEKNTRELSEQSLKKMAEDRCNAQADKNRRQVFTGVFNTKRVADTQQLQCWYYNPPMYTPST